MDVYKYRGGDNDVFLRDLNTLKNNCFFAPSLKSLNDPSEGFIDDSPFHKNIELMINLTKNSDNEKVLWHRDNLKKEWANLMNRRFKVGVYSLAKSPLKELMWAHYANSHKGFCIEYELDELTKFDHPKKRYIMDVQYESTIPKLDVDIMTIQDKEEKERLLLKEMIGYKSKLWEHEDEIRLISDTQGLNSYNPNGLKGIYFGVNMDKKHEELLMSELKDVTSFFYKMKFIENSYNLTFETIS